MTESIIQPIEEWCRLTTFFGGIPLQSVVMKVFWAVLNNRLSDHQQFASERTKWFLA